MMHGSDMMNGSNMMGRAWGSSGAGLDGILSTIISLATIIGIILLVFWAIRQYSGSGINASSPLTGGNRSAMDILRKRYAQGEIDGAEFKEKMTVLSGGG